MASPGGRPPSNRNRGPKKGPPGRSGGGQSSSRAKGPAKPRSGKPGGGRSDRSEKPGGGRSSGGAPRRYSKSPSGRQEPDEAIPGNQSWGGLARKGALRASHDELREYEEKAASYEHDTAEAAKFAERQAKRDARQARSDQLLEEARTAVARANAAAPPKRPKRKPRPKPARERSPLGHGRARDEDEVAALHRLLGAVDAKKQLRKLKTASQSYEAERYNDAVKSLKSIVTLAPSVPEPRELYGLTLYRMGRYRAAADELETFREVADSTEQNPVLMDCYRAQQRWADVAELWEELAGASPGPEVLDEGRIVMSAALAEQGLLDEAVRLLEKGWKRSARPREHHLRRAYALGDLYERSGDLPRARSMFDWVVSHDRDFVDASRRLRSLR